MKSWLHRLFVCIGIVLSIAPPSFAQWDKGFNFRATSGFVTDPADTTYVLASDTSSTTRNGATFQYTTAGSIDSRDRNNGVDGRLAGMNFVVNGGSQAVFTLTLPAAGVYDVYLAFGDHDNEQTINAVVKDGGTAFITITNVATGGAHQYVDATGAVRTAAQWIADSARGGTAVQRTFASTSLVIELNAPPAQSTAIAHLFVHQVSAGSSSTPRRMMTGVGD